MSDQNSRTLMFPDDYVCGFCDEYIGLEDFVNDEGYVSHATCWWQHFDGLKKGEPDAGGQVQVRNGSEPVQHDANVRSLHAPGDRPTHA